MFIFQQGAIQQTVYMTHSIVSTFRLKTGGSLFILTNSARCNTV